MPSDPAAQAAHHNLSSDRSVETITMRIRAKLFRARSFWNPLSVRGRNCDRTPMHRRITAAVAAVAMLAHGLVPAYAQSVVVDPSRPANTPGLETGPNGVPVVNIVTPNSAGLSHNRFTQFNVGPNGLVLNNSATFGRSQLGGMIFGNPNLQGGTARTILGEVTGASRSTLEGMTEVFGASADWVLVNANGITCNGCGFLNIPRATLSTGVPVFDGAGGLSGLSVNQGTVTIGANGVNAVGTDYFDIVARTIEVNGAINGKDTGEIGLFAGRNDFDLATRNAVAKAENGAAKPAFGIDSSAVGGMYAGRITMVGTEAGVGVKAPTIGAGSGGVRLDSNGNLVLRKTTSRGAASARATQKIEVKENTYAEAALTLRAGGDIEIFTGIVTGAAGDALLEATNIIAGGTVLAAGLAADGTITAGTGSLTVTAANDFTVATNATVAAGGDITTSQATRLVNNATFSANGSIAINANGLTNNGVMAADGGLTLALSADLANAAAARLVAVGDNSITASAIANSGTIASNAALNLASASTLTNDGLISATTSGSVSATGGLTNSGTIQSLAGLDIMAASLANTNTIAGNGPLSITTTGLLAIGAAAEIKSGSTVALTAGDLQAGGLVESAAAMMINAGSATLSGDVYSATDATLTVTGAVMLTGTGNLVAGNDLTVSAGSLANEGALGSQRDLAITIAGDFTNNGSVLVERNATVVAGGTLGQAAAARLAANGTLGVTADVLNNTGVVEAGGAFTLSTATSLTNAGRIEGFGTLAINDPAGGVVTASVGNSGTIRGATALDLWATTLDNTGSLESEGDINLNVLGALTSDAATSVISATNDLTINAGDFTQSNFALAGNDVTVALTGAYTSRANAQLSAGNALALFADAITNEGAISGTTGAELTAATITNGTDATVQTLSGQLALTADTLTNAGALASGGTLLAKADTLHNNGGLIVSVDDMELRGRAGLRSVQTTNREGGVIETVGGGDITIRSDDFRNLSTVTVAAGLRQSFDNEYIPSMNTPIWVPNLPGYMLPGGWEQMVGDVPSGHIFLPHPDVIAFILEDKGATADQWDPNWWQEYAPTSTATFDPFKWTAYNPDEAAPAFGGDMLTVHVTEDVLIARGPVSQVISSGDLIVDGGSVINRHSVLSAADDIQIDGTSLDNSGTLLTRVISVERERPGGPEGILRRIGWGPLMAGHETHIALAPEIIGSVNGTISAGGDITGNLSGGITNTATPVAGGALSTLDMSSSIVSVGTIGATGSALPISALTPLSPGTTPFGALAGPLAFNSAADLGLGAAFQYFTPAPAASPYIYETRFQFIDAGTFFGADYFFQRIGIADLGVLPKRLGDAYFDTRLVNDQIFRTTGRRWIDIGVPDERAQMQALIDAAAAQSAGLQLTPGVALTADQIARLTADIVWYETITIDGQEVLAPRLYLSPTGLEDRNPSGALIVAGGDVSLTGASVTNTRATIEGGGTVSLVSLDGDIANRSGRIIGGDISLVSAGSIINERLTTVAGNGTNRIGTIVDRESIIAATGEGAGTNGDVTLNAQDTITIRGGTVAGVGDVVLEAESVEISSVQAESFSEGGDSENGSRIYTRRNLGSTVTAGGDLDVTAQAEIVVESSDLAADGDASLTAGDGVFITATQDVASSEVNISREDAFSSSSKSEETLKSTANVSTIKTGGDLSITSVVGDVVLVAPEITSGGSTEITSVLGRVALLTAEEESFARSTSDSENPVWWKTSDQGHHEITNRHVKITTGGGLSIEAGGGIIAEIEVQGSLRETIDVLADKPGMEWVAELRDRPDVNWQLVEAQFEEWDYEAEGLSQAAAAVIALAVAAASAGALSGALIAAGIAEGTVAHAALLAGMKQLAGSAVVQLINNQGDIGATLKALASEDSLKSLATAMVAAGLTSHLTVQLNAAGHFKLPDNPTPVQTAVHQLQTGLLSATVNAGVSAAIEGTEFGDNLTKGFSNAVIMASLAGVQQAIGDFAAENGLPDGSVEKILAHAVAGGLAQKASGGKFLDGALAGGLSEILGSSIGESGLSKEKQIALQRLIGAAAVLLVSRDGDDAEGVSFAGGVAASAHEHNYLKHDELARAIAAHRKLTDCVGWVADCSPNEIARLEAEVESYMQLSITNTARMLTACSAGAPECSRLLEEAEYFLNRADADYDDSSHAAIFRGPGAASFSVSSGDVIDLEASLDLDALALRYFQKAVDGEITFEEASADIQTEVLRAESTGKLIVGGVQVVAGVGGFAACAGSVGLACIAGAALGAANVTLGANTTSEAVRQIITNEDHRTFIEDQLIGEFGFSEEKAAEYLANAELLVGIADVTTGGVLVFRHAGKNFTFASNSVRTVDADLVSFGRNANQNHHTWRHIDDIGMDRARVQNSVLDDIPAGLPAGPHQRRITVDGVELEYRIFKFDDGSFNVGTIFDP